MTTTLNNIWQLDKLERDHTGKKILFTRQYDEEENDTQLNIITELFSGEWDEFVDTMVAPACENLFLNRGFSSYLICQHARSTFQGKRLRIDVIITNENHVLVVGVRRHLGVDSVQELIADLKEFKQFFPEYNDKQLYGSVAGIKIDQGADKYAYRQGLFVLAQSGESVTILNDVKFQPKVW